MGIRAPISRLKVEICCWDSKYVLCTALLDYRKMMCIWTWLYCGITAGARRFLACVLGKEATKKAPAGPPVQVAANHFMPTRCPLLS